MTLPFVKMEGLGNDYIYIDAREQMPHDLKHLVRRLSDRHRGIGGDGLVLITRSIVADFGMRIFNADGSEAEMCGNASRCVGKYVYDRGLTKKHNLTLETRSGIKQLELHVLDGRVEKVTVHMGAYRFDGEQTLQVGGGATPVMCINMGNPHAVLFFRADQHRPVHALGPQIEKHPAFPDRTNVEFVRIEDRHRINMRVWERGSGETMACGTGACAAAVAARLNNMVAQDVTVVLRGGELEIEIADDQQVKMTGKAKTVFEGTIEI